MPTTTSQQYYSAVVAAIQSALSQMGVNFSGWTWTDNSRMDPNPYFGNTEQNQILVNFPDGNWVQVDILLARDSPGMAAANIAQAAGISTMNWPTNPNWAPLANPTVPIQASSTQTAPSGSVPPPTVISGTAPPAQATTQPQTVIPTGGGVTQPQTQALTLKERIRRDAIAGIGQDLGSVDQWNWYYVKATGAPYPIAEDMGFVGEGRLRLVTFDEYWSRLQAYLNNSAPAGVSQPGSTGTGTTITSTSGGGGGSAGSGGGSAGSGGGGSAGSGSGGAGLDNKTLLLGAAIIVGALLLRR